MRKNIVFYGNANHGKSTMIGYILAALKTPRIDLDKMERYFRAEFGRDYNPNLLYTWLINKDKYKSGLIPDELSGVWTEGFYLNVTGESLRHVLRPVALEIEGENVDCTFIDTPGQHPEERDKVLHLGEVGVFCVEVGQVLDPDFDESYFDEYEIWSKIVPSAKPIILLTKIDLEGHNTEEAYREACEKIRVFGEYDEDTPIIPVAVIVKERRAMNVLERSEGTPWYTGNSLIDAVKRSAQI